jgi:Predicted transcriptional regulators
MNEHSDKQKLMSVSDVSKITGVSVRTLRYYDEIGLLTPTRVTESCYRLYDESALRRLQIILLYRELEFSLKEIIVIMGGSGFDMEQALNRQIELLQKKKTHIENLITLAQGIKVLGVNKLDFSEFDVKKIDEYEEQAKATWGTTPEYQEFERKTAGWGEEDFRASAMGLMGILAQIGSLRDRDPSDEVVQDLVKQLQAYITEHYYTCSDEVLLSLGRAYSGGGSMQRNIDKAAGEGTAEFATRAIEYYCRAK